MFISVLLCWPLIRRRFSHKGGITSTELEDNLLGLCLALKF